MYNLRRPDFRFLKKSSNFLFQGSIELSGGGPGGRFKVWTDGTTNQVIIGWTVLAINFKIQTPL